MKEVEEGIHLSAQGLVWDYKVIIFFKRTIRSLIYRAWKFLFHFQSKPAMCSITSEKGWTRLYAFLKWKQQDGQGPGSWNAGRWEQKEPGHTPGVALFPLGCREGTVGVCLAVGAAHVCAQAHAALPAHSAEQWLQWLVLPERAYLTSRWESTKEAWKWTQWSRLLAFHPLKDENIREGVTSQFALAEQGGKENLWAGWGPGDLCWP